MRETHELELGDGAPDFCLPVSRAEEGEQKKTEVCLHDFRGQKPVVLTFYLAAFTPL